MLYRFPTFTKRHLRILRGMIRYKWITSLLAQAVPGALQKLMGLEPKSVFPLTLVTDFIQVTDHFSELLDPVVFWQMAMGDREASQVGMSPTQHEAFLELVSSSYDGIAAGASDTSRALIQDIEDQQDEILKLLVDAPAADPTIVTSADSSGVRLLPSGRSSGTRN